MGLSVREFVKIYSTSGGISTFGICLLPLWFCNRDDFLRKTLEEISSANPIRKLHQSMSKTHLHYKTIVRIVCVTVPLPKAINCRSFISLILFHTYGRVSSSVSPMWAISRTRHNLWWSLPTRVIINII